MFILAIDKTMDFFSYAPLTDAVTGDLIGPNYLLVLILGGMQRKFPIVGFYQYKVLISKMATNAILD